MKESRFYLVCVSLFLGILLMSSCSKDESVDASSNEDVTETPSSSNEDTPPPSASSSSDEPTFTIKKIKALYKGTSLSLKDTGSFGGVIISDAESGNTPNGYIMIQSKKSGIAISLDKDVSSIPYKIGDSVNVVIDGSTLKEVEGNLILTGISLDDIKKVGEDKTVKPTIVTLDELKNNFDDYSETLVQIGYAYIFPKPAAGETYEGETSLVDGSSNDKEIQLVTNSEATFNEKDMFFNANYTGIALYGGHSNKQILPRNFSDIIENDFSQPADIIITGIMADPRGYDQKIPGEETNYSEGTVTHSGGYEYIQLMALKDIDFSQSPYSVVIARDGYMVKDGTYKATEKGWAEGEHTTFKFNLTTGSATAGSFFYVGSSSKRIAGYYPEGESTDISNANWIRSIDVMLPGNTGLAGDDFGQSTSALLANTSKGVGIAVFRGTTITSTSIPIDAVFYNQPDNFNAPNSFLIPPNSDLYNAVDGSGNLQLYYGQGENTFTFSKDFTEDKSLFLELGGVFSPSGWNTKRTGTVAQLGRTSQLSDIETGAGATIFQN